MAKTYYTLPTKEFKSRRTVRQGFKRREQVFKSVPLTGESEISVILQNISLYESVS